MAHDRLPHHAPGPGHHPGSALAEEVILEHRRLGAWLRVAAVDPATGLEAVATGPADAPAMVERLALAKLSRLVAAR
jgi:hypothetical protein